MQCQIQVVGFGEVKKRWGIPGPSKKGGEGSTSTQEATRQ